MQYFLLSSPPVVDKYHLLAGPEQEHSRKTSTLKEGVNKVKSHFSASEGMWAWREPFVWWELLWFLVSVSEHKGALFMQVICPRVYSVHGSAHNSINWVSQGEVDIGICSSLIYKFACFFPSRETRITFWSCPCVLQIKNLIGVQGDLWFTYMWFYKYSEKLLVAICPLLDGYRPVHYAVFLYFPSLPHSPLHFN